MNPKFDFGPYPNRKITILLLVMCIVIAITILVMGKAFAAPAAPTAYIEYLVYRP